MMKKFTPALFLVLLFACKKHHDTPPSGTWTQTSTYPGGPHLINPIGFAFDNRLYLGLGSPYPGTYRSITFYSYDGNTDAWLTATSFPDTTAEGVGFTIGGTGYLLMNHITTTSNEQLYAFDTATRSWMRKADFPGWTAVNSGFVLDGKAYVGFGTSQTATHTFFQYDPASDSWSTVKDFPGTQYAETACFVIGNYAYVATGVENINGPSLGFTAQSYRYDAASDSWSAIADFPGTPRGDATGFSVGNKGYIVGGIDSSGNYLQDMWQYDPSADKWSKLADFPGGVRGGALGFSGANAAYYGFGNNVHAGLTDLWEYKP